LAFVRQNKADAVTRQMIKMLGPLRKVHTITSDNGREFAFHERVTARLGAHFYFAHPYCAWERGLNENTNGLVRQYFPKGADFHALSWWAIKAVQERLNQRPRKILGYRTPHEIFFRKSYALTT
jgi:IS30 family transposase